MSSDCLIVGGGVVGLSLAYELAASGARVRVLDAGEPGREASWAGAGIFPPAPASSVDPLDQLFALSNAMHRQWSAALREETGIDTGFRRCGGLYLSRHSGEAADLDEMAGRWQESGIEAHRLGPAQLRDLEPAIAAATAATSWLLPDESQLRNPRHLKALLIACRRRGVEVSSGMGVDDFELRGDRIVAAITNSGRVSADQYCVTAGAWTRSVVLRAGHQVAIRPVRGQIVLLDARCGLLNRIVNDGPRYLVPREDGHVLVGSTEEDVGFDRANNAEAIAGLLAFAQGWAPALAAATFERAWTGFRPATVDGRPYLGRLPAITNAFVAAGHFRSGLQLSAGTAVVMRELMLGQHPQIDLTPFRVDRPAFDQASLEA